MPGGRPARSAYAMPWGTRIGASTTRRRRPAAISPLVGAGHVVAGARSLHPTTTFRAGLGVRPSP